MEKTYIKQLALLAFTFFSAIASIASVSGETISKSETLGDLYTVTFRVDMNEYTGSINTVHVKGLFNDWCEDCGVMDDSDMDGVYEVDILLPQGYTEYKYSVNNWSDQENLLPGSECTVTVGEFTNRTLTVSGNQELDVVCWGSCSDCDNNVNIYDVTFQLDLSEYTGSYTNVNINGLFNNWCGGCAIMEETATPDVYAITIPIIEGTTEYKFTLDAWDIAEDLTPGDPCIISGEGFANRVLTVEDNMVLDPVCWEDCNICGEQVPSYDVTFQVDMSMYPESFTNVNVSGLFNSWCGECAFMTETSTADVYEITLEISEGMTEYKFTVDNWTDEETLDEGLSCTVSLDGYTNRFVDVTEDIVLIPVCWEACTTCADISVSENALSNPISIYPNPGNGILNLDIPAELNSSNMMIEIYTIDGKLVYQENIEKLSNTIDASHLESGIYNFCVKSNNQTISSRVLIEK